MSVVPLSVMFVNCALPLLSLLQSVDIVLDAVAPLKRVDPEDDIYKFDDPCHRIIQTRR